jgi:hypothetical protein
VKIRRYENVKIEDRDTNRESPDIPLADRYGKIPANTR